MMDATMDNAEAKGAGLRWTNPHELEAARAISSLELICLKVLMKTDWQIGFGYLGFSRLVRDTTIPKEVVRAIVRGLTDKGLAQYGRGLSSDEGEFAGAGYAITEAGASLLHVIEET